MLCNEVYAKRSPAEWFFLEAFGNFEKNFMRTVPKASSRETLKKWNNLGISANLMACK